MRERFLDVDDAARFRRTMLKDAPSERRQVEDLYLSLRGALCRYLISCGLDMARAQDATQEAFVRLYTILRDGAAVEDHRSWLFRVARNLAADILRSQRRRLELEKAVVMEGGAATRSAEDEMIARQEIESFRKSVSSLPPRQRQCFELRVQGFKYREIADFLQIDISTVGELLGRAIRRLRKQDKCGV